MATKTGLGQNSRLLLLALNSQNNRGTSLLEVLAAIVIITTVLAIISPMLFLVAASRVHTRQVEQAIDLAQSEIALIQARMTRGVSVTDEATLLPAVAPGEFQSAPAPNTIADNRASATATDAFRVDVDGDRDDFIVQTFRDAGATFGPGLNNDEVAIFRMGVRVYSIAAKGNTLETELASVAFGGLQDRTTRPLAALYTEISRSDLGVSLDSYEDYLAPPPPP